MQLLSNDNLRAMVPSAFTLGHGLKVTDKFVNVPTIRVVDALRAEGWMPTQAVECRVRREDNRGFQKHMIRFRQEGDRKINDYFPEIVLINGHDGTTAYQLHAGLFRLVCSNGMVVADSTFAKVSVKHIGFKVDDIIEGSFKILKDVPQIVAQVETMKSIVLTRGEQEAFAKAAIVARYGEPEVMPVQPANVLHTRRSSDEGQDLWRTFNRVQENLTRGGIRGRTDAGKLLKVREIKNIDKSVGLNKALWTLADEMRKLKTAS